MTDTLTARLARLEPSYRSPLRTWMAGNFDELWLALATMAQPNWPAVAGLLAELGVVDGRGKAPTPRCVRDTWRKVIAARRARRRARQGSHMEAPA